MCFSLYLYVLKTYFLIYWNYLSYFSSLFFFMKSFSFFLILHLVFVLHFTFLFCLVYRPQIWDNLFDSTGWFFFLPLPSYPPPNPEKQYFKIIICKIHKSFSFLISYFQNYYFFLIWHYYFLDLTYNLHNICIYNYWERMNLT